MATLTFRDENRVIENPAEISRFLEGFGLFASDCPTSRPERCRRRRTAESEG